MRVLNTTTKLMALALLVLLGTNLRAQVTADFTANVTSGCSLPFQVQFTDLSTTASGTINSRTWDFGNGSLSSAVNPTATYNQPGIYNVRLIVRNSLNQRDTLVKTAYIEVSGTVSVTPTVSDATCYNCPDGGITLNVSGGTPPYTYIWSNATSTQDQSLLVPGTYSVTVTDITGCSTVASNIRVRVICQPINVSLVLDPSPSCYGYADGVLRGSATGGRAPYGYGWYDPYYVDPCQFSPPCPPGPPAPDTLAGVRGGTYALTVYDQDGCTGTDSITVTEPPQIVVAATTTSASCDICADGSIIVTASGGVGALQYSMGGFYQSSNTFINVPTGNYNVLVKDATGCVSDPVNVRVDTFCSYTFVATTTDVLCFGTATGSANFSVIGGTPPYRYYWGAGMVLGTLTNLAAGQHQVTVVDGTGCSSTHNFTINQPLPLTFTGLVTPVSCTTCNDGEINLTPAGGTAPYNFVWNTGATTEDILGLARGFYDVTVTDNNGCTVNQTFYIDTFSNCALLYNTDVIPVNCNNTNNGSITITPNGGNQPWYYAWSNGATTNNIAQLTAGTYYLTITDATNCMQIDTFVITTADSLSMSMSPVSVSCAGCTDGGIDLTVTGGVPPYSYMWNNGATTEDLTGVAAGYYIATVTDRAGCINARPSWVPSSCTFIIDLMPDTALCMGLHSLTPTIVSGGVPPYSYIWGNGQNTSSIIVTTPGTYEVTVVDGNNCYAQDSVHITDANSAASITPNSVICLGNSLQLNATGGTSYMWGPVGGLSDGNISNPVASPTATTTYVVEIDNGTCVSSRSVTITVINTCVWPGDADDNGLADNDDVLAIGIGYGETGPARTNASLVWEGQPSNAWADTLANGSNYKHIDTNGDGVINADDTLAISLNYGLTHPKTDESRDGGPTIYIELPDSVAAGQTVQGALYLGSDTMPLTNVYGVKFSMNYNMDFVQENSISFSFAPSWMGTPGVDVLTFQKDLYTSGRIDGAITGINHVNRSGFGAIGYANFTMKDDISGKDFIAAPMLFTFTNVRAIDINEADVALSGSETEIVATQTVGIGQINNPLPVSIYPNPAEGVLHINAYGQTIDIKLLNVLGASFEVPIKERNGIYTLDIEGVPAGVYVISIQSTNHLATKRVVIQQ